MHASLRFPSLTRRGSKVLANLTPHLRAPRPQYIRTDPTSFFLPPHLFLPLSEHLSLLSSLHCRCYCAATGMSPNQQECVNLIPKSFFAHSVFASLVRV